MKGMAERVTQETHIRAWVAQDAMTCVARGAGMVLENVGLLRKVVMVTDRRGTELVS